MPRSLTCPKCATAITVPDGYTKTGIFCPACRTPVDVRTGAVYQRPAPKAPAPAEAPLSLSLEPESAPAPGIAPPHMYDMPPPLPERSRRLWLKRLVATACLLVAAGIGLIAWMVHSAAKEVEMAPLRAEWESLSVPEGWFSIQLPGKPATSHQGGAPGGGMRHSYTLEVGKTNWRVEWFDQGVGNALEIPFDFNNAIERFASSAGCKVDEIRRRNLIGFEGRDGYLTHHDDYIGRAWCVRRGNRVYFLAATGLTENNVQAAETFMASLRFTAVSYDKDVTGQPDPLHFRYVTGDARMDFFEDEQARREVEVKGGTPPYSLTLHSVALPQGLKATTEGALIVVDGATPLPGGYTVGFNATDYPGCTFSGTISVVVEANPFKLVTVPAADEDGRVMVNGDNPIKIEVLPEGPVRELEGDGEWYMPYVPSNMSQRTEFGGLIIEGPPGSGQNARLTVRWNAKGKAEEGKKAREYRRELTFMIVFKSALPKPPEEKPPAEPPKDQPGKKEPKDEPEGR